MQYVQSALRSHDSCDIFAGQESHPKAKRNKRTAANPAATEEVLVLPGKFGISHSMCVIVVELMLRN